MSVLIVGLLLGGTYALMAMGLQLQYGVARVMNLAYGEVIVAGAFGTFWFFAGSKASPLFAILGVVPLAFVLSSSERFWRWPPVFERNTKIKTPVATAKTAHLSFIPLNSYEKILKSMTEL